jgi:hypothetical protein
MFRPPDVPDALVGLAGFVGCAYFAWVSFATSPATSTNGRTTLDRRDLRRMDHTAPGGLALDTRCLRERIFFGVLVINFVVGCTVDAVAQHFRLPMCAALALEPARSGRWPRW